MSREEFTAWRALMGFTQAAAGRALGLAVRADGTTCDAVRHYERGSREVPASIALLCRYIERFGVI